MEVTMHCELQMPVQFPFFLCNGLMGHTRLQCGSFVLSNLHFCMPCVLILYGIEINSSTIEAKLPGFTLGPTCLGLHSYQL